jgi:hypothetical protein
MINKKRALFPLSIALLLLGFTAAVQADDDEDEGRGRRFDLVGAWDVTITPDDPDRSPFHAFHIYNFGGTQTNSNVTCNGIAPSPSGLFCGDGYGVWRRIGRHRFVQTFYLQVYDLSGEHFAFIKTRGLLMMEGKNRMTGHNEAFILIGTDLANPLNMIPLGTETIEARRVVAELPSQ